MAGITKTFVDICIYYRISGMVRQISFGNFIANLTISIIYPYSIINLTIQLLTNTLKAISTIARKTGTSERTIRVGTLRIGMTWRQETFVNI